MPVWGTILLDWFPPVSVTKAKSITEHGKNRKLFRQVVSRHVLPNIILCQRGM